MRIFIFIFSFFAFACNQHAQEDNQSTNNEKVDNSDNISITNIEKHSTVLDIVKIDTVADIPKGTNERSASFIKKRLQALVGNYLKEKCTEHGLEYPPKFILFRFFKHEREFEVWAGNSRSDSLRRILLFNICAVDDIPGTKLERGDGKTPEGFYNSPLYYGSTADFMWIKLNNSEINIYGKAGYGSSFKMCLNYPNSLDRLKTKTIMKHSNPGSAICIHGNCVSIGCISFVNKDYLPVYLAALGHNTNSYGTIKIHIFPFRFENYSLDERTRFTSGVSHMTSKQVLKDWNNLEEGYNLFNKTRRPVKFTISKDKYLYTAY